MNYISPKPNLRTITGGESPAAEMARAQASLVARAEQLVQGTLSRLEADAADLRCAVDYPLHAGLTQRFERLADHIDSELKSISAQMVRSKS